MGRKMTGDSEILSKVKVVFTFKYDLGRNLKGDNEEDSEEGDEKKYEHIIKKIKSIVDEKTHEPLFPDPKIIPQPPWQHFSRSYLSMREPVLLLYTNENHDKKFNITLGNEIIPFTKIIKLYHEQRVISIVLSYILENKSPTQIKNFYNRFNQERGDEYLYYMNNVRRDLKKQTPPKSIGSPNNWLESILENDNSTKKEKPYSSELDFEYIVRRLRQALNRNGTDIYYFQNFRTLFFVYDKFEEKDFPTINDCNLLYSLLTGNAEGSQKPAAKFINDTIKDSIVSYQNKYILTDEWATVVLLQGDVDPKVDQNYKQNLRFENTTLFLFDFAHMLWFICQNWIYILPKYFKKLDKAFGECKEIKNRKDMRLEHYGNKINKISDRIDNLHKNVGTVQQLLIEVKDVDLMFYNSGYTKIMEKFFDSLNIKQHIELVESNVKILDSYSQRLKENLEQELNNHTANATKTLNLVVVGASILVFVTLLKDVLILTPLELLVMGVILFFGIMYCANYLYCHPKIFLHEKKT